MQCSRVVFCPGSVVPRYRNCLLRCIRVAFALALIAPGNALTQEVPSVVDSNVWLARFEEWVEQHLVSEELVDAAENLPTFDRRLVLRVLDRLADDEILNLRELPVPPEEAEAKMLARGIDGDVLEAARLFAEGEEARALQMLRAPELERNGAAQHMRAQLLDHLTAGFHPIYRLQVIELYREALRLAADLPQGDRARLRIGQIYLELRFAAEARAALGSLLASEPVEPYRMAAQLSLVEAAYADRAPVRAIEHLAQIDLSAVQPETRTWVDRRHADSLLKLERYGEAVTLYRRLIPEDETSVPDPLLGMRMALALLHTREWRQARDVLASISDGEASTPILAVASLLSARAHRRVNSFEEASTAALRVTQLVPNTQLAALAAVEVLEAERARENESVALPPGTASLVRSATFVPSVGLLSYLALGAPTPGDTPEQARRRLGSLGVTLPPGMVQQLAHSDLVHRLSRDLAQIATGRVEPDPAVLVDVGRYLRPATMDENVLLLAIQSFMLGGDTERCARWALTLQRREPRPLRRGIATWRAVRCRFGRDGDANVARRMMILADSGEAGPFALAVAAIAAEIHLQHGETERAALTYARALESFSEPAFVGPVLLRLGEIEVALGRDALGMRRLSRGLALTDAPSAAGEPFRKGGIVALARAAARNERSDLALRLLQAERDRVEGWWADAYAYLLLQIGADGDPDGEGLFARGARAGVEFDLIQKRLEKIQRRREANVRAVDTRS